MAPVHRRRLVAAILALTVVAVTSGCEQPAEDAAMTDGLLVLSGDVGSVTLRIREDGRGRRIELPDPATSWVAAGRTNVLLATLVDAEGRIAIPGLHDRVRPLTDAQRHAIASLPVTREEFRRQVRLRPGVALLGGDLPLLHPLVEVLAHLDQGSLERAGIDVVELHLAAGPGGHLGDAVPHQTAADNANLLDCHVASQRGENRT